MKEILFVAPGVSPPLTEGRKLFVTELARTLNARDMRVNLLDGASGKSGAAAIHVSLRALRQRCMAPGKIAALVVFPYGTFRGLRALANEWLVKRARSISARSGIPDLSVIYSCAGMDLQSLGRRYGPALAVGRRGARLDFIHLGTSRPLPSWRPPANEPRRLLFLCGYQQPTRAAWRKILLERGLIDLLHAGDAIADSGWHLTVAVPLLRDAGMRRALQETATKLCPRLPVEAVGEGDPLELLAAHDAFVFPYREEISVFVPTSLLEALSIGIPTLAADHAMYRALTIGAEGARCHLHRGGDAADLAEQLDAMRRDYASVAARAAHHAASVRAEWNIERSADELLDAIDRLAR